MFLVTQFSQHSNTFKQYVKLDTITNLIYLARKNSLREYLENKSELLENIDNLSGIKD